MLMTMITVIVLLQMEILSMSHDYVYPVGVQESAVNVMAVHFVRIICMERVLIIVTNAAFAVEAVSATDAVVQGENSLIHHIST